MRTRLNAAQIAERGGAFGRPLVGFIQGDVQAEDVWLQKTRYWVKLAHSYLEAAKTKWNFAFAVKGQWQPALDLVNGAITAFQHVRQEAQKVIAWAKKYVPDQYGNAPWQWGARDLAIDYDAEAGEKIDVLISIQTALLAEIAKAKSLALSQSISFNHLANRPTFRRLA